MFHTGDLLMLRFDVAESYTAALVTEDNGQVWTDSCVEFFIAPGGGLYYNFETTCIGRMLLSGRKSRTEDVQPAPAEVLASVKRFTTYPFGEPFAEREGDNRWSLTLAIPPQALFRHALTRLERSRSPDEPLPVRRQALAPPLPVVEAHTDGEPRLPPPRALRSGDV